MQRMIKNWEGLRLKAYRCPAGVWTIGYGHTRTAHSGQVITREQAEALFADDLFVVEAQLTYLLCSHGVAPSQCQWDALASLAFNVGIARLHSSTLWRKVCQDSADPSIHDEFMRWTHGGGRRLPGLVKRRSAEAARYFNLIGDE